jgi:uncharacterized protein (TIGR02444 family)
VELQDAHGQNVPLLLWTVWAARRGRTPDVTRGAALARAWEAAAGAPLRQARRALKRPLPGLDDGVREAFRTRLKAVELDGERTLLQALEPLTGPGGGEPAALLARAAQAYGAPLPPDAFRTLLQRL